MGMVWYTGRSSDRKKERRWHTAIPFALAGIFFALSTVPGQTSVADSSLALSDRFYVVGMDTVVLGDSVSHAGRIGRSGLYRNGQLAWEIWEDLLAPIHWSSFHPGPLILSRSPVDGGRLRRSFCLTLALRMPPDPATPLPHRSK